MTRRNVLFSGIAFALVFILQSGITSAKDAELTAIFAVR